MHGQKGRQTSSINYCLSTMSDEPGNYNHAKPVELAGLSVLLDRLEYHPELPAEVERPFPYVYFLTIRNHSDRTVRLGARKWIVTDQYGEQLVVEGEGIVGKKPQLAPGEEFSYNSYHIIGENSVAEGSFHGIDDLGRHIFVRIPRFEMRVPVTE